MKDIPPEKKNIVDKIPQWLRLLLFVLLWIVVSLGYTSYMAGKKMEDIAYSEFKEKVAAGDGRRSKCAGHALAALLLSRADPLSKVTIIDGLCSTAHEKELQRAVMQEESDPHFIAGDVL